jgi:hypothetical protein
MVNSRTLLEEYVPEDRDLDKTSYSVVASRLVSHGGFECNRVEARLIDNHYLLMGVRTDRGFEYEPFGIVDKNKRKIALDRMYNETMRLAKERARKEGNKVIDLTSRANKVKGDDRYYVPNEGLDMCG